MRYQPQKAQNTSSPNKSYGIQSKTPHQLPNHWKFYENLTENCASVPMWSSFDNIRFPSLWFDHFEDHQPAYLLQTPPESEFNCRNGGVFRLDSFVPTSETMLTAPPSLILDQNTVPNSEYLKFYMNNIWRNQAREDHTALIFEVLI